MEESGMSPTVFREKGYRFFFFSREESRMHVEVTNISAHGIWLMEREREHFLPYDAFPWFREQPVSAILRVEEPAPGHFHWPELDVDLTVAMIEHPEQYPEIASS